MSDRVSVCIPTFQGVRYLSDALRSACAQARRAVEVLVVDDASTDGTAEVAASFANDGVRVVRNPQRLGLPGNWNKCLELARGDYVLVLGQDDHLEPMALATLAGALDGAPDAPLAFGRREVVEEHGSAYLGAPYREALARFLATCPPRITGPEILDGGLRQGRDPTWNVVGEPSFVLLRRQAALAAGGFDAAFRQLADWDMWLRLSRTARMAFTGERVGVFRAHPRAQSALSFRSIATRRELLRFLARVGEVYAPELGAASRRALARVRWRHRLALGAALVRPGRPV